MGNCESIEVAEQTAISKKIDKELYTPPVRLVQKLLLLGPGESGKSTCVKQMQIIHMSGFSEAETHERKYVVYSNTVRNMLDLTTAMPKLGIKFGSKNMENEVMVIENHVTAGNEFQPFTPQVASALKRLWADQGVRETYERRNEFQLNDSAHYFFDILDRSSQPNYKPTDQDIIRTRVPTTGVTRITFLLRGIDFKVFDVGGQRSGRRKWIHIFDDVNAIIFVAAISEYDQNIREDNRTNRLIEALELFDSISNSMYFQKSSMILFLNKKDLFAEKIQRVSLKVTFPKYKGGLYYDEGIEFIKKQFGKFYRNRQKLYFHETCATDTNQVRHILNSVIDTIIQENLKDTGML